MHTSIEKRLLAWEEIRNRLIFKSRYKPFTITISRQVGCDAFLLAQVLARELEVQTKRPWKILSKSILDTIIEEYSHLRIKEELDMQISLVDSIISSLLNDWGNEVEYFSKLATTVWCAAQKGNCIIVGRGAAFLTQELDNCFHVKLVAPLDYRIKNIIKRWHVNEAEARESILEKQKIRDHFLEVFLAGKPRDNNCFDVTFNSARLPMDKIVQTIIVLFDSRFLTNRRVQSPASPVINQGLETPDGLKKTIG